MAWIETIDEDEATGDTKRQYDVGIKRAGRVFNIVKINSLKPKIMRDSIGLYLTIMHGSSGLSRAQREMVATVVSKLQNCHYWTQAHGEDLRQETNDEALVKQIKEDYRSANLDAKTMALLEFAEKMTTEAFTMTEKDVQALRDVGWADEDILDLTHVAAYFNYITRIADALGVDLEDFMEPKNSTH